MKQKITLLTVMAIMALITSTQAQNIPMSHSTEAINGRYYRAIRFFEIPSLTEQQKLEDAGIKLLYYISPKTYVASVSNDFNRLLDSSFSIVEMLKLSTKTKMHSELSIALLKNKFPPYAINAKGEIGITFTYPQGIPHQVVIDQLANYKITYQNKNSHRISIWLPKNKIEEIVSTPFVCFAELIDDLPIAENNRERTNHRCNWLAQEFPGGHMYNGTGVNVMLQDGGIVGPHIDFTGRFMQQYINFSPTILAEHPSMCAGILMGAGNLNSLSRGMGWGANLFVYAAEAGGYTWQGFDSIYTHYYSNGIVISSTSYTDGYNAGYTTLAQTLDQQNIDMPSLIHVFSSGNEGTSDFGYGAGAGWGNITGGNKQSKNSIAVGNVDYQDVIYASSSRGPASDGRLKPELVAVGTNVTSTSLYNSYATLTGTSMACPAVAGTLTELYQAYKTLNGGGNPSSGLMKAILMNTADDLGNPGPDFTYGYGRINGRRALLPVEQHLYFIDSVSNTVTNTHTISVPANTGKIKILAYWHDYPAAINATVDLVNDIDITVTDPNSTVYNPWLLDFTPNATNLNAIAVQGHDVRNNHEQVTIDNPAQGNYLVSIQGANIPFGPQKYFLTYSFEPQNELVLTYPNGGEAFSPSYVYNIRWDALGNIGTFMLEYSTDNGVSWSLITSAVAANTRYFDWTAPATLSGKYIVRITRGAFTDVSDATFSIFTIPSNLVVDWACPDSLKLSWSPLLGATSYDIFKLGAKYMDSIGTTTATSMVIYNLNNFTNTYWFSVRARGAQNAVGLRALAIKKDPGVFCPGYSDASVEAITSPSNVFLSCMSNTNVPVIIKIHNPSLTPLTAIPVSFSVNGGPAINEIYSATLPSFGKATYTFTASATLSTVGSSIIKAWTSFPGDVFLNNDTTIEQINYSTATIAPPTTENFELFPLCSPADNCEATVCPLINGFENLLNGQSDDIDWRTFQGKTGTLNSGPDIDYNPGTAAGKYLYLESSLCYGKTAILQVPCVNLTSSANASLNFAYHMYGSGTGSLHVDIYSGGVWTNDIFIQSGDHGNLWIAANVSLSAYAGQIVIIRFRGITGPTYSSDIAIDAIGFSNVTSIVDANSENKITIWPNPTSGYLHVTTPLKLIGANYTVYDIIGKMVLSGKIKSANTLIDAGNLSKGIYLFSIGENSTQQYKVIKE